MGEDSRTQGSLALEQNKPRVITIEAAQSVEAKKLRVAAYARVSSASDDQANSFGAQTRYFTTLITENPAWELADIYADEAVTGTSVEKREDFKRLLADCRRGLVDKVLTKSVSRFARNSMECLVAMRELRALGIGIFFEEQNIDTAHMSGEMMAAIFASTAQTESETISKNVRWGYQRRMINGTVVASNAPYGYTLVNKEMVINEAQALVVRRIFNEYLSGISIAKIADMLNQESTPTKANSPHHKWQQSTIRYILSNERYIGDALWQKNYATDTLPTKQVRNTGERAQYYIKDSHESIVTKDTFMAAQSLLAKRNKDKKVSPTSHSYPLQGKLSCRHCSAAFRRSAPQQKPYWVCRTHYVDTTACPITQIPETELYAAFLRLYHKLKHHGRPILEQMITQLQAIRNRRMLWSVDIVELNNRICEITSQNRMLTLMKQQGGIVDPDFFISRGNDLAEQLRAAKLEKERLMQSKDDDTIPKTVELLEILDDAPEILEEFDRGWFDDLIDSIAVESNTLLRFRLKNGLELTETIERTVR